MRDGQISRRVLLSSIVAGAGVVACGGSDPFAGEATGQTAGGVSLVAVFGAGQHESGRPQRFPFVLGDAEGIPMVEVPDSLEFQVRNETGTVAEIEVLALGAGLPRRYFPVRFTPESPGVHTFVTVVDGELLEANVELFEDGALPILRPGDALPALDTPTVDDERGVTPICTRSPQCDFHAMTLPEALADGPTALLVATPAFCESVVCGPILDLLIEASATNPRLNYIHSEVYADATDGVEPAEPLAPLVEALQLTFEPSLLVTDPEGVIIDRLDNIFGIEEIEGLLSRA